MPVNPIYEQSRLRRQRARKVSSDPRVLSSVALFACLVQNVPAVDAYATGSAVVVNEVVVARVRTGAGNLSPADRAASAANVLRTFEPGATVKIVPGPEPRLMLGQRAILTVTAAEATANGSSVDRLAENWSKAIKSALALPPLLLGSSQITVPVDGATEFKLTGALARKTIVASDPANLLLIRRMVGTVQVTGTELGQGSLVLKNGVGETRLPVKVAPYAADLPQQTAVMVTGQPADPKTVASAIGAAVLAGLKCAPGSTIKCRPVDGFPLQPGMARTVPVDVSVASPGHVDSKGVVNVTVTNRGGGRSFEDLLWYSNEPENLRWSGQLYWARFATGSPVRLLWHHYNKSASPLYIQYVLANRSDVPADVLVMSGDAEPDQDPIKAGYWAGVAYWNAWLRHSGTVLRVPPRSVLPIVLRRMAPGDTVSGLATIRLIDGSDDLVMVANALTPADLPELWKPVYNVPAPWGSAQPIPTDQYGLPLVGQPKHVYQKPSKTVAFEYNVGGPYSFVRVGQNGIPGIDQDGSLSGNFGVHYTIEGTLTNPTDKPAKAVVEFEASAGYAGALFLVNGELLDAKILPTKAKFVLLERTLQPGDEQFVRIETMPLSGASYPATITVRPPH